MNRYTIYCTETQTKKALELGAPIASITCYSSRGVENAIDGRNNNEYTLVDNFQQSGDYWCKVLAIPTAEQMIEWLEEQDKISDLHILKPLVHWTFELYASNGGGINNHLLFATRKEATLAAIDAALEYLTNNK